MTSPVSREARRVYRVWRVSSELASGAFTVSELGHPADGQRTPVLCSRSTHGEHPRGGTLPFAWAGNARRGAMATKSAFAGFFGQCCDCRPGEAQLTCILSAQPEILLQVCYQ